MVPLVCLTVVVCAQTASRSRSCPAFKTGRRSSMSVGRPARALSFPRVSASGRATSSRTARCSGTRRGRLTTCIMDTGVRTRRIPHRQRRCARTFPLALLLSRPRLAHQSTYGRPTLYGVLVVADGVPRDADPLAGWRRERRAVRAPAAERTDTRDGRGREWLPVRERGSEASAGKAAWEGPAARGLFDAVLAVAQLRETQHEPTFNTRTVVFWLEAYWLGVLHGAIERP